MLARLRLSHKLFLVTALLAVPLFFITVTYVNQTQKITLRALEVQRRALPLLAAMEHLADEIHDYGAKLPLWVLGAEITPMRDKESREEILKLVDTINLEMGRLEGFDISYWRTLEQDIRKLANENGSQGLSFQNFAQTSENLANYIKTLSYHFRFYSASDRLIAINRLTFDLGPALSVSVNRLRGFITYKAFVKEKSVDDIRKVTGDLTMLNYRMREIELSLSEIPHTSNSDYLQRLGQQMRKQSELIGSRAETFIQTETLDPEGFFDEASSLLKSIDDMNALSTEAIEKHLLDSIEQSKAETRFLVGLVTLSSVLVTFLVFLMARSLVRGVRRIEGITERIARGERDLVFHLSESRDEIESIIREIYKIYVSISGAEAKSRLNTWLLTSQKVMNDSIRGISKREVFAERALRGIADTIGADAASFYLADGENLKLQANFGLSARPHILRGQGLLGAALMDGKKRYFRRGEIQGFQPLIESSLGHGQPIEIIVYPVCFEDKTEAVLEFMNFKTFDDNAMAFLEAAEENTAILLRAVLAKDMVDELLLTTQMQSEELRLSNVEMEEKSEQLNNQQKLLKEANEELEEQRSELEAQNEKLEKVVENLAEAKKDAEEASREADKANRFKSIFLANISHELRTPLNSIMILSQILADNREGNMSEMQAKNASTIYSSGRDLLNLINEILDLSKIEAGKLDIHPGEVRLADIAGELKSMHEPVAQRKQLGFEVTISADCPVLIRSDTTRVAQIIRNFVANAIKFTEEGSVKVAFTKAEHPYAVRISVKDSGVGIPKDKQALIFEPFKQLDNSLSRKHEGTGLGLSISKNLAVKLGGKIELESQVDRGSTFTLLLPEQIPGMELTPNAPKIEMPPIAADDFIILALEGDDGMAGSLQAKCRSAEFRCLIATNSEQLLGMAQRCSARGIILDLQKDDERNHGLIDELKKHPRTRSIPLHLMRSWETPTIEAALDDVGLFLHSIDSRSKRLPQDLVLKEEVFHHKRILIVDDDIRNVFALRQILHDRGCEILVAANGREALERLDKEAEIHLVLMDIMMPEMDGFEAMRRIRANPRHVQLPIIALTAKAMKSDREQCLEAGANDYLVKPIDNERLITLIRVWLSK